MTRTAGDPGVTQHAVGLQTEDGFDPPFDFFDGTFRQSAKFFGEGFIGHGDQLPEQQIAVTVECPRSFWKSVPQNARVIDQLTGCRNHDRGWIPRLVHQVGLHNQSRTKLSRFGPDPWIEVDDVEMPSLDVHLRVRRITTDGSPGEFPMLSFVGGSASADRFSDLLP